MRFYCKENYDTLLKQLVKEGNEVNSTYELLSQMISTRLITTNEIIDMFNLDPIILNRFITAITTFDKDVIGPYITEKYFLIFPALKDAVVRLKDDCLETRRCVIQFPKEHCFQAIQFLIRDNTVNVVCYMRSCDAIKNLPYDLWLCSALADMFSRYTCELTGVNTYKEHKINMVFGSLHVYKEDIKDVF